MKTLSREEIQRMVGRSNSRRNVAGNNQESSSQGFATPSWVDENYLSKSFFSTLFIIHATQTVTVTDPNGDPVGEPVVTSVTLAPNEVPGTSIAENTPSQGYTTTTVIALESIEATTNFYSDGGVSALGQSSGGGGGGASALTDLVDVAISSPTKGQALVYNSSTGKWVNGNVTPDLSDYATKAWVQQQDYVTSSALTGYATQQWVGQQGYLTSSALNGYATQQWVQQQGYLTSHQSVDGTFWGQSWSNHGSVSGNMANVGIIFQTGSYTLMNHQGIGLMIEGSAVTGSEYRATFGFHQEGALAWLNNNYVMQLKANTSTGEYLVHINNGILQIGDARLVWNSANNALKVVKEDGTAANLYATGGVSALGMSAGVSTVDAMTFNHLSVKNSMTLNGSVNIITGSSSQILRSSSDSDCIYLFNDYANSKINNQKYYYNQYDNVGLLGKDYNYSDTTWWIDPDGCALFQRVYLSNNVYLYTDGSNIKVRIGSTVYTLTKS